MAEKGDEMQPKTITIWIDNDTISQTELEEGEKDESENERIS